jgi:SAM-dependent methyltransferase
MPNSKPIIETTPLPNLFAAHAAIRIIAKGKDFEYGTCDNEFYICQCLETGLLFLNPRPADSALSTIYPANYLPYQFSALPPLIRRARAMVQKGKVAVIRQWVGEQATILDFGCGNGDLLRLLRSYGAPAWQLHGNDFNLDTLNRLESEGFEVHAGDIRQLSLPNYFDLIVLNQVIEHLDDVYGVLAAIRGLLKPGGLIFIETPSFDGLDAQIFKHRYWGGYHFPRHWYLFNAPLLRGLLEKMQFQVVNETYLTSPSFWVQSLHHRFLDQGYPRVANFFQVSNPLVMAFFTLLDLVMIKLGRKTSNLRMIGRKNTLDT